MSETERSGVERALRGKTLPVQKTQKLTLHACMKESVFGGFYRAKPVSETERSGVERALRGKTLPVQKTQKLTLHACMKNLFLADSIGRSP